MFENHSKSLILQYSHFQLVQEKLVKFNLQVQFLTGIWRENSDNWDIFQGFQTLWLFSQEKSELFSLIRNISTWSNSKNQVVKREKVRSEVLFKGGHLRASVHDRSAKMVKKIILNGEELENLEDLATKLSLRRSPQLLVDYWASEGDDEKSGKHFWVNPAGASTTYYYIEGDEPMEWILVPTNAR